MNNLFMLKVENRLQGIRTRLKELHYSASNMDIHKLTDEFLEEFDEFDDSLMENSQALWGTIKVGELNPELPKSENFSELLTDLRGILIAIKKESKDDLMWSGIINIVDDFLSTINRYIYLTVDICKK